jgi:hypothetical protein
MKKIFTITLLLCLLMCVGCAEDYTITADNSSATLKAILPSSSRTLFDGNSTIWQTGDILSVVADNDNTPHTFTYLAEDTFSSATASFDDANTIYALYAAETNATIDGEDHTASVRLGAALQSADINSPAAHIADYDVLYGCADVVASGVEVAMHHSVAAIEINLTNDTAKSLDIKSITLTAPEDVWLVRQHTIDLAAGLITPVDDTEKSNSIELTFPNDALQTIAAADQATMWIATAPFELEAEDVLVVEVATSDGVTYRCEKKMTEAKEFGAGSIMSTNIALEQNANQITIAWDLSSADSMPNNFPIYKSGESNNTKAGSFSLGAYDFVFSSEVAFYYYDGSTNYIRFVGVKNSLTAEITLPKIDGYKLSSVAMASVTDNTSRGCTFTITDGGASAGDDFSKRLNQNVTTFDTSGFTSSNNHTIVVAGTQNSAKNADLTHLTLCYSK